jgi:hypothetical protein
VAGRRRTRAMIRAEQHIPDCFIGFIPERAQVPTMDELLMLDWIQAWSNDEGFERFTVTNEQLIAEYEDGRRFTVAHLEEP